MSAQPVVLHTGRVLVADGVVYVRELEETDDEVVRIVAESEDGVAAVSQCLRVGARAMRAAHVTVDVDVIERSFHELEARFESQVTDAVDEIAAGVVGPARRGGRRAHGHADRVPLGVRAAAGRHVRRRLQGERARQGRGAGAHDHAGADQRRRSPTARWAG